MRPNGIVLIALLTVFLSGCGSTQLAPIENAWYQPSADRSLYRVQPEDTIYSIAWAFGLDYRALAAVNHLVPPYSITAGQRLRMTHVPRGMNYYAPSVLKNTQRVRPSNVDYSQQLQSVLHWQWPAIGELKERFTLKSGGHSGISIAGHLGEPIHAATAGYVVYSGDGVRGYGNLIIVKHNASYLSAYAFNQRNLVRVGERVRAGQLIARMGRNDAGRVLLYFEIRRDGIPVNPLRFLR